MRRTGVFSAWACATAEQAVCMEAHHRVCFHQNGASQSHCNQDKTRQDKTRQEDAWFYRWHRLNLQGQINTWAGTKGRKPGTIKNTKYRNNAEPLQVKLRSQRYLSYIIASFQKPVYSKKVLLLHAHLLLKNASCRNISRSVTQYHHGKQYKQSYFRMNLFHCKVFLASAVFFYSFQLIHFRPILPAFQFCLLMKLIFFLEFKTAS